MGQIVVVNNSRSDVAGWAKLEPMEGLTFASALRNTGYAGGHQLGFEVLYGLCTGNHLCVMNSDVGISDALFEAGLSVFAADSAVGQVSFRTEDETGSFLYDTNRLHGLIHRRPTRSTSTIEETDYAAGSFFVLRNEACAALDYLFYEPYFLYWEEVDLSYRLRGAGWKVVCCTTQTVIRRRNPIGTEVRAIYYIVRNAFLFRDRNRIERPLLARFLLRYLASSLRLAVSGGGQAPLSNFMAGLKDGLRGKYGPR